MSQELTTVSNVRSLLERMKPQIAKALPAHLNPDRMMRVALTAIQNTPDLMKCDQHSLMSSIMTAAQLGLEPDGVLGQGYLVPYRSRNGMYAQFIPGYKGLITLARQSGDVSKIDARIVRENDHFDYEYGLSPKLVHRIADGDRGDITHVYAVAHFYRGEPQFEVLTRSDCEKIRDETSAYKAFKAGKIKSTPWHDHFGPMCRKSAVRALAKWLPMNVQRAAALADAYDRGFAATMDSESGVITMRAQVETPDEPEVRRQVAPDSRLDDLIDMGSDEIPVESAATEEQEESDPDEKPPGEKLTKAMVKDVTAFAKTNGIDLRELEGYYGNTIGEVTINGLSARELEEDMRNAVRRFAGQGEN